MAAGSFLPLKGRVARALLDLAEAFGQDVGQGRILIRQKVSQSDVAAMAGIARENVSRILNDWIRDKLVSRLSGYYCLEDKAQAEARERALGRLKPQLRCWPVTLHPGRSTFYCSD